MKNLKRLFYYLSINVLVSACATITVIQAWAWWQPVGSDCNGPVALMLTQVAGPAGPGTLPTAATPGILVITQVVTVPPEAWTPYPTRGIVSYKVKEGDTLLGIAVYFDVSLDDLMALNDIKNPDRVVSGVELLIPPPPTQTPTPTLGPTATLQPTETSTPTPTAHATPSPIGPTPTPQTQISAVIGAGDLNNEHVELRLAGGGGLSLFNWQLRDEDGNIFLFPNLTLRSGGVVTIYTKTGEDTVTSLYWNQAQPVWQSGETATLVDAQGRLRATFKVP